MRILHVVPTYWPAVRYGGTIVSTHGLCRVLAKRGNDVVVYTTNADGERDANVPINQPVLKDGVEIWYFRTDRLRRLFYSGALKEKLKATIGTYDIVHSHAVFLWPTVAVSRAAAWRSVPYIISPRGMLVPELIARKNRIIKTLWINIFEKRNFARAAAIHFTSEREKEDANRVGMRYRSSFIVPNGVDLEEVEKFGLCTNAREEGQYILYLGRLNWKKGIDDLIRAIARVPGTRLVVAGNDEESYRTILDRIVEEEEVDGRVDFVGGVSGERKWRILKGASAVVLPSISENFGNVVIEAMAVGTPVVVTDGVGLAQIVVEYRAGIVAKKDPASIAAAIKEIVENKRLAKELGENGARCVQERFSWLVVGAEMESWYRRVTGGAKEDIV